MQNDSYRAEFEFVQRPSFKCHVSSLLKLSFRTIASTAKIYPLSYSRILLVTFIRPDLYLLHNSEICCNYFFSVHTCSQTKAHTDVKRLPNRCNKHHMLWLNAYLLDLCNAKVEFKNICEKFCHISRVFCSPQKHTMWSHTISSKIMYPNMSTET